MKNLARYLIGALAATLLFSHVPVYQGRTPLYFFNYATATVFPAWIPSIKSIDELGQDNFSNTPFINVISYVAGKNRGGGLLWLNPADVSSPTNHCTIFVDVASNVFYRELLSPLTVTQCGALGDGTTDDTVAEQRGINAIINGPILNTIQGAPSGELDWPPGTYVTTASLILGPSLTKVSVNLKGAGRTITSILGSVAGPVFLMSVDGGPSSQLTDMYVVNSAGSSSNSCVTITGNSVTVRDIDMNCAAGIFINGGTNDYVYNALCDQCLGTALVVQDSHTIYIDGFDVFGTSTVSQAVQCLSSVATSYDVILNGLTMIGMGQSGVTVSSGCDLTLSSYAIDGRFPNPGNPATHRGLIVGGGTVHLGAGTISGWDAEGIFIGGGAVYDNGASISQNVFSASATNRYSVANTDGTYIKTGGSISGGLQELGLVFTAGNNDARTSISGTLFDTSNGSAFNAVSGGGGSILSAPLANNTMRNLNLNNAVGNTPIIMNGVSISVIGGNIISTAHAVTAAVQILTGGTSLITYNASNSGTFPGTAGTVTSTGNVNY